MDATIPRPERQIFAGTSFAKLEIDAALRIAPALMDRVELAWARLRSAWDRHDMVEIKLACEQLQAAQGGLEQISRQVGALAGSMARTFGAHINRRS